MADATQVTQRHPQPASLLTLPLELRRMIYALVLPRPISAIIPRRRRLLLYLSHIRLHAIIDHSQPVKPQATTSSFDFSTINPTVCALRSVNRQLYSETRDLVSFPKYRIRITIDDELCGQKLSNLLEVMKDEFMVQNASEVWLQFAGDIKRVFRNERTLLSVGYRRWFTSVVVWSWRGIKEIFGRINSQSVVSHSPLKQIVQLLETYPRLSLVLVKTFGPDLLAEWKDPVRDLPAFAPLLEREVTVNVEVGALNTYWGVFLRRKRIRQLTEGPGEVLLYEQDTQRSEAPRGAQFFGAKLRTLV